LEMSLRSQPVVSSDDSFPVLHTLEKIWIMALAELKVGVKEHQWFSHGAQARADIRLNTSIIQIGND